MRVPGGDAVQRCMASPAGDVGEWRWSRSRTSRPPRSSSRWWCGVRAPSSSVGRPLSSTGGVRCGRCRATVAVGDGRRRAQDGRARDERAGLRRPVRGTTGPCAAGRRVPVPGGPPDVVSGPWSRSGTRGIGAVEPSGLPDAAAVARGWHAQLDRGMQVELPDDALARSIRTACRHRARRAGVEGRPGRGRGARGLGSRPRGGVGVGPPDRT